MQLLQISAIRLFQDYKNYFNAFILHSLNYKNGHTAELYALKVGTRHCSLEVVVCLNLK